MLRQATKNEIAMFLFDLSSVGVSKEKEFAREEITGAKHIELKSTTKGTQMGIFLGRSPFPCF